MRRFPLSLPSSSVIVKADDDGIVDCWFGFIFWGMAYLTLYPGKTRWAGAWRSARTLLNYFIILVGAFILVGGTYASVQSIVDSYRKSEYGSAFTCVSNAL